MAVMILTLGLGFGATTVVGGLWYSVMIRPLPFTGGERHAMVVGTYKDNHQDLFPVSSAVVREWDLRSQAFETVAGVSTTRQAAWVGADGREILNAVYLTGNYFHMMEIPAVQGRTLLPSDDRGPGSPAVAVVSHEFWQNRLGADPGIVGSSLNIQDHPVTVVGVITPRYKGHAWDAIDIWFPMSTVIPLMGERYWSHNLRWLWAFGKLRPGVTRGEADAELDTITADLERQYPEYRDRRARVGRVSVMYFEHQMDRFRNALRGAVLLLVLCAMNVASLGLTRDTQVRSEMALQSALGARRRQILLRIVLENLLVALGGAAVGVLLAVFGTRHLSALGVLPPVTFDHRYLDSPILFIVLLGSLILGLVVSLAPIRQILRSDLHGPLKSDSESTSPGVRRAMKLLTVAEVALVTVLLAMTAVQARGYLNARLGNPGFEADSLLSVQLEYRDPGYHTPEGAGSFVRNLLAQVESQPGVEGAALVARWTLPTANMSSEVVIEGRDEGGEITPVTAYRQYVTPGFFSVASIGLREGVDFGYQDDLTGRPVVIINQAFADRHWPAGGAIGARVQIWGGSLDPDRWWTIIGVTETTYNRGFSYTVTRDQDVYIPLLQAMQRSGYLFVRTTEDPSALILDLRQRLRQMDEEAAITEIQTVRQRMQLDARDDRFIGATVLYFSLMALIVAMIGLYGTLAFMVRRRTREIGIRMALGASRRTILQMTALYALKLVAAGIALGGLACFAVSRFLFLESEGFSGLADPRLFLSIAAILLLVSSLAIWIPVRYATRVQPVQALRHE